MDLADPTKIAEFLTSEDAYLIAAGAVFLLVWLLPQMPRFATVFATEKSKRVLALAGAVLPAIGLGLVSHAPVRRIISIAIVALLAGLAPKGLGTPKTEAEAETLAGSDPS